MCRLSVFKWSVKTTQIVRRRTSVWTTLVRIRAGYRTCAVRTPSAGLARVLVRQFVCANPDTRETRIWAVCPYSTVLVTTSVPPAPVAAMASVYVSSSVRTLCIILFCVIVNTYPIVWYDLLWFYSDLVKKITKTTLLSVLYLKNYLFSSKCNKLSSNLD